MSVGAGVVWEGLRASGALAALELPWPVAAARPIGEHASTRRFFRLLESGGAEVPRQAVLVVYPAADGREVERYRRTAAWFRAAGIEVPRVLAAGDRSLLVTDAGDTPLTEIVDRGARRRAYRQCADIVSAIQRHGRRTGPPNRGWALDRERMLAELEFMERHALSGWLGARGGRRAREPGYERLVAAIERLPQVVCHRDFHARNLLSGLGGLTVVDFQDAMKGPFLYDLGSLVWDNYCDVPRTIAEETLGRYWERAELALPAPLGGAAIPDWPPSLPAGVRQSFCLVAVQRHLKALGTFGYQVTRAGRPGFARYAARTWRHARRGLTWLGWDDCVVALRPFERLAGPGQA